MFISFVFALTVITAEYTVSTLNIGLDLFKPYSFIIPENQTQKETKVPEGSKYRNIKPTVDLKNKTENPKRPLRQSESLTYENSLKEALNWSFSKKSKNLIITEPEDSPYAVAIYVEVNSDGGYSFASGALVSLEWVLTIDYAIYMHFEGNTIPESKLIIYAGGNSVNEIRSEEAQPEGAQVREGRSFYYHESGICLLKTDEKFNLSSTVKPLFITMKRMSPWNFQECRVTGYGLVENKENHPEDFTRKTQYPHVEACKCKEWNYRNTLYTPQVCVNPKNEHDPGLCVGDDGAVLVCDNELLAVADYPYTLKDYVACDTSPADVKKCSSTNTVSRFTLLYPYRKWILSIIEGEMTEKSFKTKFSSRSKKVRMNSKIMTSNGSKIDSTGSLRFAVISTIVNAICKNVL